MGSHTCTVLSVHSKEGKHVLSPFRLPVPYITEYVRIDNVDHEIVRESAVSQKPPGTLPMIAFHLFPSD